MIKQTITFIMTSLLSLASYAEPIDLANLTLKTIDGHEIHFGDIIGKKPVYLKFWASWCVPCREQMPHLQHTFETYGNDIEIISINLNINDDLAAIKKTRRKFGLTVPIIRDKGAILSQSFDLKLTPYHVLLNKQGKVIHTGYKASDILNTKIAALASASSSAFEEIQLENHTGQLDNAILNNDKPTVLFFTSAWCDWYLKESRPAMSAQCIQAQQAVNALSKQFPQLHWQGVLSRLWTGEEELNKYKKKYQIPFDMTVDTTNTMFFNFKVDNFPTLIAIQQGKEVFRIESFYNPHSIAKQLAQLSTNR